MKIKVGVKNNWNKPYTIFIKEGILKEIPKFINKKKYGKKYAIITDSNVKKLYAGKLQKHLKNHGINSFIIPFQAGEKSKNIETVEKICSQLNILGIDRHDCIIALGGGVTGDIAGFVASIHLRGIPFIQVPTTLLAMTDSSIGGKTGIDLKEGKNLIGTFNQPQDIFIDTATLQTLPQHEILNGIAEIIKHSVIADASLFKYLDKYSKQILELETKKIIKMLKMSINIKKHIVSIDTHEKNIRMLLNYGHTIGHAIENVSDYEIPHGQAIAIGMFLINRIGVRRRAISARNADKINKLLYKFGLPNTVPNEITYKQIAEAMRHDKKIKEGKIWFVVPKKIGKVGLSNEITNEDIEWALKS